MESFVIRIYRRSDAGKSAVIGTLESIATGTRTSFHSQHELLQLIDADLDGASPKKAGKRSAAK